MKTRLIPVMRELQAEARLQKKALELEQYHLCSGSRYKNITCKFAGTRNLSDRVLRVQSSIFSKA